MTETSPDTTGWVPLFVRLEDYEKVTALVANLESQRADHQANTQTTALRTAPTAPTGSEEEHRLRNHIPWSHEDLARLSEGKSATALRWARALDVCAESPDKWFSTSMIAAASGMGINEWRDAPRKMKRHLLAHYPQVPTDSEDGAPEWPLCWGGSGLPNDNGEVWWAITTEMAQRWRAVRNEGQQPK